MPPAFSIFSRADSLILSASIVRPCFNSPPPRIFSPATFPRISFDSRSSCSLIDGARLEAVQVVEIDDRVMSCERPRC